MAKIATNLDVFIRTNYQILGKAEKISCVKIV